MKDRVYACIPRKSLETAQKQTLSKLNKLTKGKAEQAIQLVTAYKDLEEALNEK